MLSSHITPPRKSNDGNYSQRSCKHHFDQRHPSASCFKLRVLSTPFLFPALSGRPDTSPPASHFSSSQSWVTTLLLFCRIVSTVGLLGSLDCTHFFNILTLPPESGVISWRKTRHIWGSPFENILPWESTLKIITMKNRKMSSLNRQELKFNVFRKCVL